MLGMQKVAGKEVEDSSGMLMSLEVVDSLCEVVDNLTWQVADCLDVVCGLPELVQTEAADTGEWVACDQDTSGDIGEWVPCDQDTSAEADCNLEKDHQPGMAERSPEQRHQTPSSADNWSWTFSL